MATRYFKSNDAYVKTHREVCSTSSGNRSQAIPSMPNNSWLWIEIGREEFVKLRREITRRTQDALDKAIASPIQASMAQPALPVI